MCSSKISIHKFTFENSAIHLGKFNPMIWTGVNQYVLDDEVIFLGWNNSDHLEFRARPNEFVGMFFDEKDQIEFWNHLDKHQLNCLIGKDK